MPKHHSKDYKITDVNINKSKNLSKTCKIFVKYLNAL